MGITSLTISETDKHIGPPGCENQSKSKKFDSSKLKLSSVNDGALGSTGGNIEEGATLDLSMKYDVILADPPWTFSVWNAEKSDRHASHKYNLMTTEDICNLPISSLTADNCALFLWATWPNIRDAFKVIEAWGFTYRTLGWEWVKAKKNGLGFHLGMGYYTRSNPEPCLLAVKGRMAVAVHDVTALIYSPVREHSRKPDEQYTKIEKLYPSVRYLELFARHRRLGWDVFGNEVEQSITI